MQRESLFNSWFFDNHININPSPYKHIGKYYLKSGSEMIELSYQCGDWISKRLFCRASGHNVRRMITMNYIRKTTEKYGPLIEELKLKGRQLFKNCNREVYLIFKKFVDC